MALFGRKEEAVPGVKPDGLPGVQRDETMPPEMAAMLLSQPEGTKRIGKEEVAKAIDILTRYKQGKANLETRIVEDELWWELRHWEAIGRKDGSKARQIAGRGAEPTSAWLFNSITNKHADAMDNYPEPMVLPRAADDQATAQALSSVLPVVLEQADYEQVYSDVWWRKLKQGTGVTGIFWDPAARGGLGDIAVRSVNLLMLYWEPGVQDIQDSPDLFHLSLEDTARLTAQYPQLAGHAAGVVDVPRYIHEDGQTTANKSVVVDWYYKRPDENGKLRLHYCKLCNGVVLYASQNDSALATKNLLETIQIAGAIAMGIFTMDSLFRLVLAYDRKKAEKG